MLLIEIAGIFAFLILLSMPIVFALALAGIAGLWIGGYPMQQLSSLCSRIRKSKRPIFLRCSNASIFPQTSSQLLLKKGSGMRAKECACASRAIRARRAASRWRCCASFICSIWCV